MRPMKILITCSPMLVAIERLRYLFEEKDIAIITPKFAQVMKEEDLLKLVPTVEGWIIGDDPVTEEILTAGKNGKLKAAVRWGIGVDNVDFEAAKKLGIPITNTPGMFGNEVADVAIAYLIGLARQTYFIDREVRKGNWFKPAGVSLTGKTAALVGLGDIGSAVAKRLRAFDMKINAYDPFTKLTTTEAGVDQLLPFPESLADADFVVLCCALTPSSYHLINRESIGQMKDGVYIINVSRGPLIDEKELISALTAGKIKAAALDVFENEPLPLTSPLHKFDNCIFGSHNGSNTHDAVTRASMEAVKILFGYLHIE
jgi:D-3-phosphoglycerate dehydrogenase